MENGKNKGANLPRQSTESPSKDSNYQSTFLGGDLLRVSGVCLLTEDSPLPGTLLSQFDPFNGWKCCFICRLNKHFYAYSSNFNIHAKCREYSEKKIQIIVLTVLWQFLKPSWNKTIWTILKAQQHLCMYTTHHHFWPMVLSYLNKEHSSLYFKHFL